MYETTKKGGPLRRPDILFPELSFKVVGVLIKVYKELGGNFQEKIYQRAIASELRKQGVNFQEQVLIDVLYGSEKVGRYYLDFIISQKSDNLILEIKKDKNFNKSNIVQVHAYLKATNMQLGILANFTQNGVKFKRIVNLSY